jgi:hypothetical protein
MKRPSTRQKAVAYATRIATLLQMALPDHDRDAQRTVWRLERAIAALHRERARSTRAS